DWLTLFSNRVERALSRFADLIIVNSYAGLEHAVARGFPRRRMLVIPNGIDTERFRPDAKEGRQGRREWGRRADLKVIGLVGRLDPMKDHPPSIRTAAHLLGERRNLLYVGVC